MNIRRFEEQDAKAVSELIRKTMRIMIANSEAFACCRITDTKGLERLCSKTP